VAIATRTRDTAAAPAFCRGITAIAGTEGTIMPLLKHALLLLAAVAALAAASAPGHAQSAYSYPWCGVYPRQIGGYACYYKSYETCMKTMMIGIGGSCMRSPFYRGPDAGSSPPAGRRPRHGRHT
jgi:hypothetical protein